MSEVFKLENVELFWPQLYERNKLSGKFQVDLSSLEPQQVEAIEKTGVSVRSKDDDRGYFVTCKSKNYEIVPYDKNGDVIGREILVGNGSRANVMVKPFSWKSPTGQSGVSLGIVKLVVTELNKYVPENNVVEEDTL